MPTTDVVSVAVQVGQAINLYKFNINESLNDIIKRLCEENDVFYVENKFALQYVSEKSNKKHSAIFVTEENRIDIINGTELKLDYSPVELSRLIYNNLLGNGDINWALEKLSTYIGDQLFASKAFKLCYSIVMVKLNSDSLPPKLYCYCLKAILGFLKYNYIQEVEIPFILKLVQHINGNRILDSSVIEQSLRVLELSVAKNQYTLIASHFNIDDLIPHIWERDAPIIQVCALKLMNNLALYCMSDHKKTKIIETMNSSKFLSTVSSNILYRGAVPSKDMSEQLHIYQTLILNVLLDRTEPYVMDYESLPDFEFVSDTKRYSNFDSSTSDSISEINSESNSSSNRNSTEMGLSHPVDRISNIWKSEVGLYHKRDKLVLSFLNLEISELNSEIKRLEEMPNVTTVNRLVFDCIMYFSKHYHKNYQVSLFSEGSRNFVTICYDVVNLIIHNILHVGKDPVNGSTAYCPLIFSSFGKQPFLEEFFCVAMWLFERTKREMKTKTYDDYKKVLKVMERQLTEGLASQPKTFHELEMVLRGFTYTSVSEQWHSERKAKQQQFFASSSAVRELRIHLKGDLIELIKRQRIKFITKGSKFPIWNSKCNQKVKNKFWFARYSPLKKCLLYSPNNVDEEGTKAIGMTCELKTLSIRKVEDFVVGKRCPHLKDYKYNKDKPQQNPLGFSLIIDQNTEESLDFVANDREVYDYWVDALNALFGNKLKSNLFREDLNKLLDMDLQIQLLDLEGVDCPVDPPPVPPLPDNFDFYDE